MIVETAVWVGLTAVAPASTRTVCSTGAISSAKVSSTTLADLDDQPLAYRRRKPVELGPHVVLARLERRDHESAVHVGDDRPDDVGGAVAGGDPRAKRVGRPSRPGRAPDIRAGGAGLRDVRESLLAIRTPTAQQARRYQLHRHDAGVRVESNPAGRLPFGRGTG